MKFAAATGFPVQEPGAAGRALFRLVVALELKGIISDSAAVTRVLAIRRPTAHPTLAFPFALGFAVAFVSAFALPFALDFAAASSVRAGEAERGFSTCNHLQFFPLSHLPCLWNLHGGT